jgi:hypothetical protein
MLICFLQIVEIFLEINCLSLIKLNRIINILLLDKID